MYYLIDAPSPFAGKERLEEFLKEMSGLEQTEEVKQAVAEVTEYLKRYESGELA